MQRSIVIISILFLFIGAFFSTNATAASDTYVYKMTQTALVYEKMDTTSKATGSLPKETLFFAQPITASWLYVPNKNAYVQAVSSERQKGEYAVVAGSNVTLYKAATKTSKAIGSVISKSVVIRYSNVAGGWTFVSYNGTFGYVPTSVLAKPVVTKTYVYAASAELRKQPTKSAPVVASIPVKTELSVYSSFLGWSFVANNTYSGYVKTADITPKSAPSKPASTKPGTKKIALTFDDGPHKKVTPQILATLKKYKVKATFFVLGQEAERYPSLIKQIAKDGHEIGNHSWSHKDLSKLSIRAVLADLQKTNATIERITGKKPTVYRPPYGAITSQMRTSISMKPVLWTIDTLDWQHRNAQKTVAAVQKGAKNGAIVLMHDIHQPTADALARVIETLQKQGYTFVTVDEL